MKDNLRRAKINLTIVNTTEDSWISSMPPYKSVRKTYKSLFDKIENLSTATKELDAKPLWIGYENLEDYPTFIGKNAVRRPHNVSISPEIGEIFTWLVINRKPNLIVEFGTAFGVSGMYWLAGLEINQKGQMLTFEPNEEWADIADNNLSKICNRYLLTKGTFEDNFHVLEAQEYGADLVFIDAIHKSDFVHSQLNLILKEVEPGALIVFDDINFSVDMKDFWKSTSEDTKYAGSFEFGNVGVIELR